MDNITIPDADGGMNIKTPSTVYENHIGVLRNITLVNSRVGKSGGGIMVGQARNLLIENIHFSNNSMINNEGYPGGGGITIKDSSDL